MYMICLVISMNFLCGFLVKKSLERIDSLRYNYYPYHPDDLSTTPPIRKLPNYYLGKIIEFVHEMEVRDYLMKQKIMSLFS